MVLLGGWTEAPMTCRKVNACFLNSIVSIRCSHKFECGFPFCTDDNLRTANFNALSTVAVRTH